MIRTEKRLRLCKCLIMLCLAFIWGNSLLPAEGSQALSDWVKELLTGWIPGASSGGSAGSGLVRKIAHFSEFACLGLCLGWMSGMLKKGKIWPFLWGFVAACVDETIQCFVPDRGPGLGDVFLDACGVAAGIWMLLTGHKQIKRKRKLKENTK